MPDSVHDQLIEEIKDRWRGLSLDYENLAGSPPPLRFEVVEGQLEQLRELLHAKQHDYGDPWEVMQRELGINAVLVSDVLLATKWGRFKVLRDAASTPRVNESIEDTLLDLAGYAIIAATLRRGVNPATNTPLTEP